MEQINYENRIVLFLDFLGFKKMVDKSDKEDNIEIIVNAINLVRSTFNITLKSKERNVTQFSDSLVVSFLINERGQVLKLLMEIKIVIHKLIEYNVICRGAITYGKMIHNHKYMFGPALNDAVKLESLACYPRVIVSNEIILNFGIEHYGYHPANDKEYESAEINSCISIDNSDNTLFINYFKFDTICELNKKDRKIILNLRNLIAENIKKNENDYAIRIKYEWMRNKYNLLVNELIIPNQHYDVLGSYGSNKKSQFYKNLKLID